MNTSFFEKYKEETLSVLMNDFVSFWESASVDSVYGGYLCGFDRSGNLFHEDKSVWQQGRSLWMFSKLYNEFGKKQLWLDNAKSGYDFINKYCFAPNGHMYFRVTRDGKPLVERRYYFSESFAIMGYAEYYKATGLEEAKQRAIDLFDKFEYYYTTPGVFEPKVNPETRKTRGHSIVMIMMNVCQCMREIDDNPRYDRHIDNSLDIILNVLRKKDKKALLECVASDGSFMDSVEGRLVNPGHCMETAWFIMREAIHRKDSQLMKDAIEITEWSLEIGEDREMGGIFYFRDVLGKPEVSLEWDMKLFWVHCEAMISLLYSYWYTGDSKYAHKFEEIFIYCKEHFADEGYPEWFGHLHRDGTPISPIKGSDWKGPFHNVRAYMLISQLLGSLAENKTLDF